MKTNDDTAAAGARYIVKNRRLAVLINVVLGLLNTYLYSFYIFAFTEVLKRWDSGSTIILFVVNPCFLVIWRILSFFSTLYDDHIVATAANGGKKSLEKTSVLV